MSLLQSSTGGKIEVAGTSTAGLGTIFSYLELGEYLAIGTFILGLITFIVGRIYAANDNKRKTIQAELDAERSRLQIKQEALRLELLEQDMKNFRVKEGLNV